MTGLIIDPFSLAYPANGSKEELEEYINMLLELDQYTQESSLDILISNNTSDILVLENNFPYWDELKSVFERHGINYIQPSDLITTIGRILKLKKIEDLGINDVLYSYLTLEEDSICSRPRNYLEEFKRIAMIACIYTILEYNQFIFSKGDFEESIFVSGDLIDIEKEEHISIEIPRNYSCIIPLVKNFEEFFFRVNPVEVWTEKLYEEAIKISIFQRTGSYEDANWKFGHSFFRSAQDKGFLSEGIKIKRLIRSIVDTILRENLSETHWLRAGQGANEPQVTRGNDRAWRKDIDREYHLHYWETEDGIEFASVVVHNDMSIPA
ncbi:hypothetical protein QNK12_15015 [Neobacillus cucumis]|nr:hypothetical protein QNK12_15015 [Neobacillus cucumis]